MKKGISSSHFLALRRRLDALGYKDLLLGTDSAPLAQQMLEDLVNTTEMLKSSEEQINSLQKSTEFGQLQIEPLVAEAKKLMNENVQLHQNLIKLSEESAQNDSKNSSANFQLSADNRRLKMMHQKVLDQNRELQKQLEATKTRLQASLEAPSISNPGEAGDRETRKTNRRAGARSIKSGSLTNSGDQSSLASTQNQITELQEENERINHELQVGQDQNENLRRQIVELEKLKVGRDEEINRLGKELVYQTGKDGFMLIVKHENEQLKKKIEKLTAQVRVVNPSGAYSSPSQVSSAAKKPKGPLKSTLSRVTFSDFEYLFVPPIEIQAEVHVDQTEASPKEVVQIVQRQVFQPQEDTTQFQNQIQQLSQMNNSLNLQLEISRRDLESKNSLIAQLVSDFAVVHDSIELAYQQKDKEIQKLSESSPEEEIEIIDNTEQFDKLQLELTEAKAVTEKLAQEKNAQIQNLQSIINELQNKKCENCPKLELQLEEERKHPKIVQDTAEEERLKSRLKQLETLIMVSKQEQQDVAALDEQLQSLQHKFTEKELELSELQSSYAQQASELQTCRANYEEAKNKIYNLPSIEQKFRSAIEQIRSEYKAVVQEAKEKARLYENATQRYQEIHKQNVDLQLELERLKSEFEQTREEASFHRTKGEEYVNFMTAKQVQIEKESQSAVSLLQRQLTEKNREVETFKKLLSDTRRQLANAIGSTHKNRNATLDLV